MFKIKVRNLNRKLRTGDCGPKKKKKKKKKKRMSESIYLLQTSGKKLLHFTCIDIVIYGNGKFQHKMQNIKILKI
jgi:hypothetical protein